MAEFKIRDYNGDLNKRWAVWVNIPAEHGSERMVFWISSKFKTKLERYSEADRIIAELKDKARKGQLNTQAKPSPGTITVRQAVYQSLEFKKNYVSPRTYQSYSNIVERLMKYARKHGLENIRIDQFTKYHAQGFVQEIAKDHKAKTINSYVGYLAAIWERIGKLTPCENVFYMDRLPEADPEIDFWDPQSLDKMTDYLKKNNQGLFLVVLMVFHCFMRPNEIRQIQFKDIDLAKGIIRIQGVKSKNRRFKYPTMSRQLIEMLAPIYKKYPGEYYLISKDFKPGSGPLSRNIISEEFKKIRRKLGIPDTLKLYSFKHTGNSTMIERGVNIRELQAQNGHHDISITEKYLRRIYNNANEKFRDLAQDL